MIRGVYQRNTQTKTAGQAPLTTPKISPGQNTLLNSAHPAKDSDQLVVLDDLV